MNERKKPAPPGVYLLEGDDSPDRLGRPVWIGVDTNGERVSMAVVTEEAPDTVVRAFVKHLLARQDPDVDLSRARPVDGDPQGDWDA